MLQQLLFLVFILTPHTMDASNAAFESAALEVLGSEAQVRVENISQPIDDEAIVAQNAEAAGIIQLQWQDAGQTAVLHVYVASERRWFDRRISFQAGDSQDERGRLLGFAVASMFVDAPQVQAPDESGGTAPASSAAEKEAARKPRVVPNEPEPSPTATRPIPDATPTPDNRTHITAGVRSLEFAGVIATGLGGQADGLGATAGVRLAIDERWWLRAGVVGRRGEIEQAEATLQLAMASVGTGFDVLEPSAGPQLNVRADLLAGWLDIGHLSADDDERDHQGREQVGGDLLGSVGYRFTPTAAVFASGGVEIVPGITEVFTRGQAVAEVPVARAIGELGFRADF